MAKEADAPQGGNSGSARRRRKNRNNSSSNQTNDSAAKGGATDIKMPKNTAAALAEPSGSEPSTPTVTGTPRSVSQVEVRSQELASAILKTNLLDKELGVIKVAPLAAGRVKRRRWFIAGLVFGGLAALSGILYANPTKSVHIDRMHGMLGDFDFLSILPDSLLPDDFIQDITRLLSLDSIGGDSATSTVNYSKGDFQPALTLVGEEKLEKVHNVILIPGIISSGLESWSTANCSRPYFRQRLWGTSTMFKAILLDKECWVQHMMLDKKTGLDPPGIKLRAAKGLDAADYFITGYWIWGKAIENLAVLGYDSNDMALAAYDWRLSYHDLERRDQYFSTLKSQIEVALKSTGKKTVLVTHSMGSQVTQYFMKWVESKNGGNGGDSWVNEHIEALVNLAGTPLGVPKTLSSLLSGEQRETVQPLANYLLDHFMNRNELARVFRSWTGLTSLLPKGGNAVWGDLLGAPDDISSDDTAPEMVSYGAQIRFDDGSSLLPNQTMDDALQLLTRVLDKDALRLLQRDYMYGVFRTQEEMDSHADDHRAWTNPLQHQLPNAPNMTIFCLYGHGATTERAYYYTADNTDSVDDLREEAGTPALRIDKRQRAHLENVDIGIVHGEGDGTVPLLSLGYMCASGWRKPLYNPHGVRIVTREFIHNPLAAFKDIRGGAGASDHINILGNYDVTADMLRIVSGRGHTVEDQFSSDILKYAERINIP
ncbi:phospholipid:diacylglycerol acyltransferase [Coemansia sp. RSA 922]|nr:phospholipid:diacylglycerol acyltransferase [Coemansia sp. S3946]KAJ2047657.1 phospholipid:diacylglycerol acyltransferase [Coemansia sp. S16]KAJ2071889.1 phospholipid:diacylglycerol acyltransferase [Coemansia sp. S155-1]KAJ2110585.1 phospholipid:diacylglycerol acyltransferase [Coemansia sp. RSA 922]